jgi:hypothetical protein
MRSSFSLAVCLPSQSLLPGQRFPVPAVEAVPLHVMRVRPALDVPVRPDQAEPHLVALPLRELDHVEPAALEDRPARRGVVVADGQRRQRRHGVALRPREVRVRALEGDHTLHRGFGPLRAVAHARTHRGQRGPKTCKANYGYGIGVDAHTVINPRRNMRP